MPDEVEIEIHAVGASFRVRTFAYFYSSGSDEYGCVGHSDLDANCRARRTPAWMRRSRHNPPCCLGS